MLGAEFRQRCWIACLPDPAWERENGIPQPPRRIGCLSRCCIGIHTAWCWHCPIKKKSHIQCPARRIRDWLLFLVNRSSASCHTKRQKSIPSWWYPISYLCAMQNVFSRCFLSSMYYTPTIKVLFQVNHISINQFLQKEVSLRARSCAPR